MGTTANKIKISYTVAGRTLHPFDLGMFLLLDEIGSPFARKSADQTKMGAGALLDAFFIFADPESAGKAVDSGNFKNASRAFSKGMEMHHLSEVASVIEKVLMESLAKTATR